jgi:hypothetical protein
MEYSALKTPKTDDSIDLLSVKILDYYKQGEYAFDPDVSSQSHNHRQAKKRVKDAFKSLLSGDSKLFKTYNSAFVEVLNECSGMTEKHLRFTNKQLRDKIRKQQEEIDFYTSENYMSERKETMMNTIREEMEQKVNEKHMETQRILDKLKIRYADLRKINSDLVEEMRHDKEECVRIGREEYQHYKDIMSEFDDAVNCKVKSMEVNTSHQGGYSYEEYEALEDKLVEKDSEITKLKRELRRLRK